MQITEGDHPHQTNFLSADEKLQMECEYYLHVLLKYRQADCDSEGCDEGSGEHHIALKELLAFPRVKALCSDVEEIRYSPPFHLCLLCSYYYYLLLRRVLQCPSCSIKLDQSGDCAILCIPQQTECDEEIEFEATEMESDIPPESSAEHCHKLEECWDCDL